MAVGLQVQVLEVGVLLLEQVQVLVQALLQGVRVEEWEYLVAVLQVELPQLVVVERV
jgi:hypothetical protein